MIERLRAALSDRYRIERELGEGGMATVYLAEDLKHERKVALKVLRPELAAALGADRFLTEIRTTANLQHPHILPLFDSGEADGFLFYVMPNVEGESLRGRLDRERQLPVAEAVRIAREVADALDYAHRQGVVHRDVKPANILLHEGRPLVADFGIALAVSQAGGGRITETGLSLGTPDYMAPEQASGDPAVDRRADVYALGCVLYEMLTGERPHAGPTAQSVLARILTEEPRRVTATRRAVPDHVDAAVAKALEKLPADRFGTAADFRAALGDETFRHAGAGSRDGKAGVESEGPPAGRFAVFALGWLLLFALAAAYLGWFRIIESSVPVTRFEVTVDPPMTVDFGTFFALSPDGTRLLYLGSDDRLWMRDFAELEAEPVPMTEQAGTPFFSPDGESWGFHQGIPGDDRIRTVARDGAAPVMLVENAAPGVSWGEDGFVYYRGRGVGGESAGIWRVSEGGGEPVPVLPDDSASYWFPESLPGGRGVLATRIGSGGASWIAFDIERGEIVTAAPGSRPRVAGGRLFWLNEESTLMTAPFDPRDLDAEGPGTPVASGVATSSNGIGHYDVSETGTLIYQVGERELNQAGETLVWRDRDGDETVAIAEWPVVSDPDHLALSPDGGRAALLLEEGLGSHPQLWLHDLSRGTWSRLTSEFRGATGLGWTGDGSAVRLSTMEGDGGTVWEISADGDGPPRALVRSGTPLRAVAVHPDGRTLLVESRVDGRGDLLVVTAGEEGSTPFVVTDADEGAPTLSPDGRWAAYVSDRSGRDEVYVRSFPGGDGPWTVSKSGGTAPRWSAAGDEIFFVNGEDDLVVAGFTASPDPSITAVQILFPVTGYEYRLVRAATYDVAPDAGRFLLIKDPSAEASRLVVVQGLFTELEERGEEGGR